MGRKRSVCSFGGNDARQRQQCLEKRANKPGGLSKAAIAGPPRVSCPSDGLWRIYSPSNCGPKLLQTLGTDRRCQDLSPIRTPIRAAQTPFRGAIDPPQRARQNAADGPETRPASGVTPASSPRPASARPAPPLATPGRAPWRAMTRPWPGPIAITHLRPPPEKIRGLGRSRSRWAMMPAVVGRVSGSVNAALNCSSGILAKCCHCDD